MGTPPFLPQYLRYDLIFHGFFYGPGEVGVLDK